MKKAFLLLVASTLTGCVSLMDGSFQTSSFATKDDFRIVATIEGEAQANYILGIGGNLRDGLVNEAKRKMYSGYTLMPNQNLTNITVDTKVTSFFIPIFYQNKRVIVSADVIEFYNDGPMNASMLKGQSSENEGNVSVQNERLIKGDTEDWKMIENKRKQRDLERFELISSFLKTKPSTIKIAKVGHLKVGDVVSFRTYTEDGKSYVNYGFVERIVNDILKVSTYDSSGKVEFVEDRFIMFKKVLY